MTHPYYMWGHLFDDDHPYICEQVAPGIEMRWWGPEDRGVTSEDEPNEALRNLLADTGVTPDMFAEWEEQLEQDAAMLGPTPDEREEQLEQDAAMLGPTPDMFAGWREEEEAGINPKDLLAVQGNKVQLGLIPPVAKELTARVHMHGAKKYGAFNWRKYRVKLSVYLDAAERHLDAIREGEWIDEDSGQPHAAHAAACMNIIMDADNMGNLVDDVTEFGLG